jgi:hypothetical protein
LTPVGDNVYRNVSIPEIITDHPEYIRPPDAPRFGFSRGTIYNMISAGVIKARLIRLPGMKKPMRLINTAELRDYIESCIEQK